MERGTVSKRNARSGTKRPLEAGETCRYKIPSGPPIEMITAYGDAQSAITAGLTLLAIALKGSGNVSVERALTTRPVAGAGPSAGVTVLPDVLLQDFGFGS